MGRNNIWAHLAIAVVLVLIAAFAGQMSRWKRQWKPVQHAPSSARPEADESADEDSASTDDDDEMFFQQWGLFNTGQNGGKAGADISAMRAWAVTRGSDQVVVAVIDSGVDYSHPDLANNIWTRPEIIKKYEDEDLTEGPVDDL